jgi:carboxypeptidase Q
MPAPIGRKVGRRQRGEIMNRPIIFPVRCEGTPVGRRARRPPLQWRPAPISPAACSLLSTHRNRRRLVSTLVLCLTAVPCYADGRDDQTSSLAERYADDAARIIQAARSRSATWDRLQVLCDDIGHRLSGSESLDRAVQWAVETLQGDGHENVRAEPVMVPQWVRGSESLEMLEPRSAPLPMLGLGGSVGTPAEGVAAQVFVVTGEEELAARAEEARGKIVLFNVPMPTENAKEGAGYGRAVRYRVGGASMAAKCGAVAALVRSVTTRSLQTPHTGAMRYADGIARIPTAAITIEYVEMIARLQERDIPVTLRLTMAGQTAPEMIPSANVVAELRGRELPDRVVVLSGHFDSWDVGQGAHDDGGACVAAMEALTLLRRLDLRPRRTIRVVLWTNEENGTQGARTYVREHADELPHHVAAIESDSGIFNLRGFDVDLTDDARRTVAITQLSQICQLLQPLGRLSVSPGHGGADIGHMREAGVPLVGVNVDMTHYFDYHHTVADTIDKIDPKDLTDHVAALAVLAYVLADMDERFAAAPGE